MRKIAIFVEGQTELIFVREFLLKLYNYQDISLECFNLFTDSRFIPDEYPFSVEGANNYFQIINIGNDKSVLSRMLRREAFMRNAGFDFIVGLRDLYSKEYREIVKDHSINWEVIDKFRAGYNEQIESEFIRFCFAIMEIEAWMLGLYTIFEKMNPILTVEYIEESLGFNLRDTDPENTFFHPSVNLSDILVLSGKTPYDKSRGDVSAIVSLMDREDYIQLLESNKCKSFKDFNEALNII